MIVSSNTSVTLGYLLTKRYVNVGDMGRSHLRQGRKREPIACKVYAALFIAKIKGFKYASKLARREPSVYLACVVLFIAMMREFKYVSKLALQEHSAC